jgi:hypothetical protein
LLACLDSRLWSGQRTVTKTQTQTDALVVFSYPKLPKSVL